jgi:hypothetical protein
LYLRDGANRKEFPGLAPASGALLPGISPYNPADMHPPRKLTFSLALSWLAFSCAAGAGLPDAGAPGRTTHFKLHLVGVSDSDTGKMRLESDAESAYAWTVRGGQRTLSYDRTHVAVKVNGKTNMDVTMSAKRFVQVREDGTVADVDVERAPERMRTALSSTYETPLAKIAVDANGREVEGSRAIVATGAGRAMLESGALANAMLMHPPYFADKNQWQAPAAISIGGPNTSEGLLTYTRVADENGLPTYAVAGTLVRDAVAKAGSPFTDKNFKQVVKGKQSYDPALGEWVVGTWSIDNSFDVFSKDKRVASTTGTIKVDFQKVEPAEK